MSEDERHDLRSKCRVLGRTKTSKEISDLLGVDLSSLRTFLTKHRLSCVRPTNTKHDTSWNDRALELRRTGMKPRDIAVELDLPVSKVRSFFARYDNGLIKN